MAITSAVDGSVQYKGRVLSTSSRPYFMDSYYDAFYALVWDDDQGKPVEVGLGTNHGGSSRAACEVDADIKTCYKMAEYERVAAINRWFAQAANQARELTCGKVVKVIAGRKVKVGTVGEIFWTGQSDWGMRVGLALPNGDKVFLAAANVEVENPADYMPDFQEGIKLALGSGERLRWLRRAQALEAVALLAVPA